MPIYNYSQLKSDVNSKIKGKIGILVDPRSTINQGVRAVLTDMDLLTTRRRSILTPNLFDGVFEYAAPTDLKGYGIITIQNQTFNKSTDWGLVPYEQFLRRQDLNTIAVGDYDFIRKLYLNTAITDDGKITISSFNSIGDWEVFGDAESITTDTNNYVEGTASLSWNISSAGGTTAGLENTDIDDIDLTEYLKGGAQATCWVYLDDKTDVTNFIFRIGSSASAYYYITTTSQSDGTAFVNGWNLLRFDMNSRTETGSVIDTVADYSAIYMTKDSGKVSETGYKFDDLVLRRGELNNLFYYSSYGWQNTSGTYLQNSIVNSDLLNADNGEYEIILAKCAELAADDVDEDKVSNKQQERYKELKRAYEKGHPSESLVMISTVADFIKV